MSVTMPRMMLIACLLSSSFMWSSPLRALGLGEIHLNSALNEPMNAEIDLIAAAPDELTALRATLASREAFTRYGIDKPPFLSSLTFKTGKSKDGRDVLLVHSTDAIPEPFVTFLVEVNWARGRLMREYTVLLDPPVYTPGEGASAAAPVSAPITAAAPVRRTAAPATAATPTTQASAPSVSSPGSGANTVQVGKGDTLTKIARSLDSGSNGRAGVDQTMIALYRSNPEAFGGNINVLRQGAVLRVPDAEQIAALNQREAEGEVRRQIEAWRSGEGAAGASAGHLRLVTPSAGGSATGGGNSSTADSSAVAQETQGLKDRVKDLEGQLAESKRLIDIRNNELSALQRKLGAPATAPTPVPAVPPTPPVAATAPPPAAVQPPAASTPPSTVPPQAVIPAPAPVPAPPPVAKKSAPAPADTGSWIDWVAAKPWVFVVLLVLVIGGVGVANMRRRRRDQSDDVNRFMEDTDVAESRDSTSKLSAPRKGSDSFVVEESGSHPVPEFASEQHLGDTEELKSPNDTFSSESAVNLDQGDPLAEADFHMAYGLYDQAADLVRIALEREPERRDLRLKLLEIYFVWGNKDAFLQTAKTLAASRERAPAGEWEKIVIMGKQICPDEPLFASGTGGGRGAGTLVDLNLEGGENRVDIDLFGDPEGERSTLDHPLAKEGDHSAITSESPGMHTASDHLDFTLDAPERGADDSPTREMPPRDEPTVESELMDFGDPNFLDSPGAAAPEADAPTTESPTLKGVDPQDRFAARLPPRADQTAEVAIDDLGLDLDQLEETGTPSISMSELEQTDHPNDAPTMVAGLDERSRRMMAEAERNAHDGGPADHDTGMSERDRDLTELERELEASFIADLDSQEDSKTAILGPESAPTVLMRPDIEPRDLDSSPTSRFKSAEITDFGDFDKVDVDSTSRLRALSGESIDLDLDRLASALGSGDTVEQPPAAEDLFSNDVFEASQRNKLVDLDVGEPMIGSDAPTNKLQAQTNRLKPIDMPMQEMEPVTMSEVGTKLDLARAYMDMGDPEGARSILEEVVQEGSASQKQEASRLIESLPG